MDLNTGIQISELLREWCDEQRGINSYDTKPTKVKNAVFLLDELVDRDCGGFPVIHVTRGLFKDHVSFSCPQCGNACLERMANERDETKFCWHCGQRLDWSQWEKVQQGKSKIAWILEPTEEG